MTFKQGESYFAMPTLSGAPQKIVTVVARNAGRVSFSVAETLSSERVRVFDGREFVQLRTADGVFTVSSASRADLGAALQVMAVVRPDGLLQRAARHFFVGGFRDAKI